MASSALLGFGTTTHELSKDEEDLKERSTKKFKEGDQSSREADQNTGDKVEGNISYKDKVVGSVGRDEAMMGESEEEEDVGSDEGGRIVIEEQEIGNYACPAFVLSKEEEKRIYRPWRRGVIVKLLGRKIGYKALETRLKQMWVKKGVINIIDLSNDYYLINFTNEDDHYAALMNGPWFIYDHYLTVKEWSPNFHPQSDTIQKVAVWVRISGLPIEYYDSKVLSFIGNRIGKTVKVDKNTLMHERGKYARICVEVDLTKSLLAMFTIKDRKYNVEYEGLHHLCVNCGRFGHYKEGCPDKSIVVEEVQGGGKGDGSVGLAGSNVDGPWMVVQKQKRVRKTATGSGNKAPARINSSAQNMGSRFDSLRDDGISDVEVLNGEFNGKPHEPTASGHVEGVRNVAVKNVGQNNDKIIVPRKEMLELNGERGINMSQNLNGTNNQESGVKTTRLAARGTFKGKTSGKSSNSMRSTREKLENLQGTHQLEEFLRPLLKKVNSNGSLIKNDGVGPQMGLESFTMPNVPRPPDGENTFPPSSNSLMQHVGYKGQEGGEEFLDANDQGIAGSSDSEMETVHETPEGGQ